MNIIGRQGEYRYLVQTGEKAGFVADLGLGIRFPETDLDSILSRGYWEPYTGEDQEQILVQIGELAPARNP